MGLMPLGDRTERGRGLESGGPTVGTGVSGPGGVDLTATVKIQAAFMISGSAVGILGVILPHPEEFMVPELLALNISSILFSLVYLAMAPRLSERVVRFSPALGAAAITAAVVLSRDPTSAYALLYLFPAVYAFYFVDQKDTFWHLLWTVANYCLAIALLELLPDSTTVAAGSTAHHFVITIGMLILVGAMLAYLRNRVENLVGNIVESARTDMLTGLLNARGANEILTAELERARMGSHRVTLLNVHVGGLRAPRSHLGHRAADEIIRDVGQLLDDSTRRIDTVARTAMSEFIVILPETDENTGFLLAEQILARFRRVFREQEISLATAIGVAAFPKHASGVDALTQAATGATEAARAMGSDRAVVYSNELDDVISGDPARALTERRTHLSTVLSLAEVLDLRDARTAAHSLAVSRYCELIANEMNVPEARVQRLRLAGMLHDIGKVGIPDSILEKPGPLSPSEWDQVRRHPEMAARILGAQELTDIREWILKRHEQPDGHGYPQGLSGDSIPLESRILAVAETYDALTNERPYRPARSEQEAIEELGRYSGSQFDGAVVDALVRALQGAGARAG